MKGIKSFYSVLNDILPIVDANPNINFRYLITATEALPGGWIPTYNPSDLNKTYEIGWNDGMKAINDDPAYE